MMNIPSEAELQGMTVNERLFSLGLLAQWDSAVKSRNRDEMLKILSKCAMSQEQCEYTTDTVLNNPAKYGF
ncbi:MAG: hypothetical protein ACYS18_00885 [Planctomycetota bacterium]|jgi:hypothetical protein